MMYKTPTFAEPQQRENRVDLDFLQMNGYVPCSKYSI
jgi:hypothetical protein